MGIFGLVLWQINAQKFKKYDSCSAQVNFAIKAHKSPATADGYKWESEAFGIKVIANDDLKNKLPWVATVIAELLDQNNDGCRDDPNVEEAMRTSLQKYHLSNFFIRVGAEKAGSGRIEEIEFPGNMYGILGEVQSLDKADINPKCTKAGKFKSCPQHLECAKIGYGKTEKCVDATIEEVHHGIHQFGHAIAYPNIFGVKPTLVSTLQNAMDKARGKRIIKPSFGKNFKWPTTAWWTNTDSSCKYD